MITKAVVDMTDEEIIEEISNLRSRRAQARESAMVRGKSVVRKREKSTPEMEDMTDILGSILQEDGDEDGTKGLL